MQFVQRSSIDAQEIAKRLSQATVGDIISYGELSLLIKRPVYGGMSALQKARASLQQQGMVFGTVSKKGVVLLDDAQRVGLVGDGLQRIGRHAARSAAVLATVDHGQLLPEQAATARMHQAILGTVALSVSQEEQRRKIEQEMANCTGKMPVQLPRRTNG